MAGISVTGGSAYFEGPCHACGPSGDRGIVLTVVNIYEEGTTDREPALIVRVCARHTNELIVELQRAGIRREI